MSITLASPAFQASNRLSSASHCSCSNLRAEDLYTWRVCAVWESLPEIRPVRMTDIDHATVNTVFAGNLVPYRLWSTSRLGMCRFAMWPRSSRMEDRVQCSRMRARKRPGAEVCVRVVRCRVLSTEPFVSGMETDYKRKRTIGFENGGMVISPFPKLRQSISEEYLNKREQFVVSHGDDRIKVVQCVEVKDGRYTERGNHCIDSGRARFWGSGWECVYE